MAGLPIAEVAALRSRLDRAIGRRDALRGALLAAEEEVFRLKDEEELAEMSGGMLRTLIDLEVTEGVRAVEELLTEGLRAVFEDQDLAVRSEIEVQRGKVSVELLTVQTRPDGSVTEGPSRDSFGGAVTTVESVLLRMIVTLRRGLRPVLFMDETLPAFDANYVHNMGALLRTMCDRLGIDLLLVTHNPAMVEAANRAYRISSQGGRAVFTEIRR